MTEDLRLPVVVGAGQLRANRERTVAGAREPLHLLLDALTAAGADAGAPELLAKADSVCAVHVASWAYDGLARRVASAVGASPAHCTDTGLGGHLPVRLLDEAAARIAAGDSDVALVVGGEAQASVTTLGKAGIDPVTVLGWSADPGGPPAFDLDQLGSPAMQAAGLIAPARVYPLYEPAAGRSAPDPRAGRRLVGAALRRPQSRRRAAPGGVEHRAPQRAGRGGGDAGQPDDVRALPAVDERDAARGPGGGARGDLARHRPRARHRRRRRGARVGRCRRG